MIATPKFLQATGGMISWGMQDKDHGFDAYSSDPVSYVAECHEDGIDWHCIQVLDQNLNGGIALHDAARSAGRHFGGWTNVPQECGDLDQLHHFFDLLDEMKCGFVFFNIEERWGLGGTDITDPAKVNNCHKVLVSEFRKRFPKKPAAVQTNFGGFEKRAPGGAVIGYDAVAAAIYTKANIFFNHEDYWVNNENLTPVNGDFNTHDVNHLHVPKPSSSTAGIFGSETGRTNPDGSRLVNTIALEIPRLKASGRHRVEWIWTMEYMQPQDRKDLREKGLNF